MKKTILCLIVCVGAVLISSSFTSNSQSVEPSNEANLVLSQGYNFVGDFVFQEEGKATNTRDRYPVYEASNACGMYYALIKGNYYKMFSGKYNGHNYYIVLDGVKWWTTI